MRPFGLVHDVSEPRGAARQVTALIILFALVGVVHALGVLGPLERALLDLRFRLAQAVPSGRIAVVDIDAQSLARVGVWPWPRTVHAGLVRALDDLGAAEIAFDVDFSARTSVHEDEAFAAALEAAGGSVVLAAFEQPLTGAARDLRIADNVPIAELRRHAWLAGVNVEPDPDGWIRRYASSARIGGETLPSLGAMIAGSAGRGDGFLIDFGIAAQAIDRISAADILSGRVDRARVAGRKVIIGASATELRDFFQVPIHGVISGALLQALAAETLIAGRDRRDAGMVFEQSGLACLLGLLWLMRRLTWGRSALAILALSAVCEVLALAVHQGGTISLDTSACQALLLGGLVRATLAEVDLKRMLLSFARIEARNTHEVLERVVGDSFDGIVVADKSGTIVCASLSAIAVLGSEDSADWCGQLVRDRLPGELAGLIEEALASDRADPGQMAGPREIAVSVGQVARVLEYVVMVSRLHRPLQGSEEAGDCVACLTFRDITEKRLAEKRLSYLARFDTLTGLPNRDAFGERLSEAVGQPASYAVIFFDLDRFKTVNDTFGHTVGDLLLQSAAARAAVLVGHPHMLSRLGGDEFAVLCIDMVDVPRLAEALVAELSRPYEICGQPLAIGVSVGIATCEVTGGDPVTIMRHADIALYRSKQVGGGCVSVYEPAMDVAVQARQRLEVELREALRENQFRVHYQPQFELSSKELVGVEALVRWLHPVRGFVSPAEFIPVAEEVGLIPELGEWVLRQACDDAAGWPVPIKVAVNVSPIQFRRGSLVETVRSALSRSKLPSSRLELEITESLFMEVEDAIRATMGELLDLGVAFALDDFGTGYSSLSYIRSFPISKIKIDRSFVNGLPHDGEAVAIVQAVISMAINLGLRTNAEGLETPEQTEALHRLGCREGQGFGLSRPLPAADLVRLLLERCPNSCEAA